MCGLLPLEHAVSQARGLLRGDAGRGLARQRVHGPQELVCNPSCFSQPAQQSTMDCGWVVTDRMFSSKEESRNRLFQEKIRENQQAANRPHYCIWTAKSNCFILLAFEGSLPPFRYWSIILPKRVSRRQLPKAHRSRNRALKLSAALVLGWCLPAPGLIYQFNSGEHPVLDLPLPDVACTGGVVSWLLWITDNTVLVLILGHLPQFRADLTHHRALGNHDCS